MQLSIIKEEDIEHSIKMELKKVAKPPKENDTMAHTSQFSSYKSSGLDGEGIGALVNNLRGSGEAYERGSSPKIRKSYIPNKKQ